MKSLSRLYYFTILLFALISCRKDDYVILPEPQGNFLVLQLGSDYYFEGGAELLVPNLTVAAGLLNLEFESKNCPPMPPEAALIVPGEADTLLYFYNWTLDYPVLQLGGVFALNDSCLINSAIELSTYSIGHEGDYDHNEVIAVLSDISILHSYLQQKNSSKIAVMKYVVYQYDAELDITIPVVKFFVLVGYEL